MANTAYTTPEGFKTYKAKYFTIDYPVDTEVKTAEYYGYAEYVDFVDKDNLIVASVGVYNGKVDKYGGQPPTLISSHSVDDWYNEASGEEHKVAESGSLLAEYTYKQSYYRTQSFYPVIYILKDKLLYSINIESYDGGIGTYEYSTTIKQMLKSFKVS